MQGLRLQLSITVMERRHYDIRGTHRGTNEERWTTTCALARDFASKPFLVKHNTGSSSPLAVLANKRRSQTTADADYYVGERKIEELHLERGQNDRYRNSVLQHWPV